MRSWSVTLLVSSLLLIASSSLPQTRLNIVQDVAATHDPVDFTFSANSFGFNLSSPTGKNPTIIEYSTIIFTADLTYDEQSTTLQHNFAIYPANTDPATVFPGYSAAIATSGILSFQSKRVSFTWTPTTNGPLKYFCEYHAFTMGGTLTVFKNPDINGSNRVDIVDLAIVARAYDTRPGAALWDPRADLDGNNHVNIIDLAIIAKNYGKILAD